MQVVIPMSGSGSRYARAGYASIKPLIEVQGRPMIEHVVRMFPGEADFLFICAQTHLETTDLRAVLQRIAPTGRIVGIAPHKLGPVHAVLQAQEHIRDDDPVLVNYCDFSAGWDYADFCRTTEQAGVDGFVTAYRGFHPHSLGTDLYAYLRTEGLEMLEIREKHAFTDQRMQEFASAGGYWFGSGALMKSCLAEQVARNLATNGEFYVSTAMQVLLERGLRVQAYELTQFLQWGTPGDLREFEAWARYFARHRQPQPSRPQLPGTTLVPMAGAGERFRREGYDEPKPLVPVAGVPMLRRALASLPRTPKRVLVCREDLVQEPALRDTLQEPGIRTTVVSLDAPTQGQADSCLKARAQLDPDQPLLIASCDAAVDYDPARLSEVVADPSVECLVWTFRDHAHANRHPRQYSWVVPGDGDRVRAISAKQPVSDDPRQDHGLIGLFWFRSAGSFLAATDRLVAENRRVRGEFYVDSVVDFLLEDGADVRWFGADHFISFGNPDDVRTFAYWHAWFTREDAP